MGLLLLLRTFQRLGYFARARLGVERHCLVVEIAGTDLPHSNLTRIGRAGVTAPIERSRRDVFNKCTCPLGAIGGVSIVIRTGLQCGQVSPVHNLALPRIDSPPSLLLPVSAIRANWDGAIRT